MFRFVTCVLFLVFMASGRMAGAADVVVYTEHYPPYSYLAENGEVAGKATELVKQVMVESGLDYEIRLVPWNRAYKLATQLDNVLVFSLLHTEKRASQFHFLAPVLQSDLFLFGRSGEAATFSREQLHEGSVRGACVIGDIGCEMLRDLGIPESQILQAPDTYRGEEKLVQMQRADVFIAHEMYQGLKPENDKGARPFEKFMKLEKPQTFCLAAGHQVRPEIIASMTSAYERLVEEGRYKPYNTVRPEAGDTPPPKR